MTSTWDLIDQLLWARYGSRDRELIRQGLRKESLAEIGFADFPGGNVAWHDVEQFRLHGETEPLAPSASETEARDMVRIMRTVHGLERVFAQKRTCRIWENGAEFYGAWADLEEE